MHSRVGDMVFDGYFLRSSVSGKTIAGIEIGGQIIFWWNPVLVCPRRVSRPFDDFFAFILASNQVFSAFLRNTYTLCFQNPLRE